MPQSEHKIMASGINPDPLYDIAIHAIATKYRHFISECYIFPPDIYFDILYSLHKNELHLELSAELSKLENFTKALKASSKRMELHKCFQSIMDLSFYSCTTNTKPSFILAGAFIQKCNNQILNEKSLDQLVTQGLCISSFMSEAGWLEDAASILLQCRCLLKDSENPKDWMRLLDCLQRLLHVQNWYCQFQSAGITFNEALELSKKLQTCGYNINLAVLYSEFATLFMLRSDYSKAYSWSVKSLEQLVPKMYPSTVVDVLRLSAKSCVLKREFKKAGLLIRQAFKIARGMIGNNNLKYADTLIDFGFYLLNVDAISQGIEVYRTALHVRETVFGQASKNLHLATAHEDLSYASYVYNYTSGSFEDARTKAEKAISLMMCLLPKNHHRFSSCKRVKALILEEMAIENTDMEIESKYLEEAHRLHKEALQLSLEAFGEMNVQTAKHYGNLGRLYQSMKVFKRAEEMHLEAIHIKEALLGPDDYEVALSVGHLASLYNYDLGYYNKAEMLYLRSIQIGKKLFGEAYSGLEYDYRGLLRVYANQLNLEKWRLYYTILSCWKSMREQIEETSTSPFNDLNEPLGVELTVQQFMEL